MVPNLKPPCYQISVAFVVAYLFAGVLHCACGCVLLWWLLISVCASGAFSFSSFSSSAGAAGAVGAACAAGAAGAAGAVALALARALASDLAFALAFVFAFAGAPGVAGAAGAAPGPSCRKQHLQAAWWIRAGRAKHRALSLSGVL